MGGFIHIAAIALIIGYVVFAVWFICRRQSVLGSIGAAAGLLCGSMIIVPLAEAIVSFICWGIAIIVVLAAFGSASK